MSKRKELSPVMLKTVHIMRNNGVGYRQIEERIKDIYKTVEIPSYTNLRKQYIEWLATGPDIDKIEIETTGTGVGPPIITGASTIPEQKVPFSDINLGWRVSLWQRIRRIFRR